MCAPSVIEKVRQRISRRDLLKSTAAAAAGVLAAGCQTTAKAKAAPATEPISFTRVVDLSHTLHPDFPAWFVPGVPHLDQFLPPAIVEVERIMKFEEHGASLNTVSYTHLTLPTNSRV